ncbi:MAG: hypothetical protein ACE5L6_06290 [Candidatus Bathyarchaeia archaeon]
MSPIPFAINDDLMRYRLYAILINNIGGVTSHRPFHVVLLGKVSEVIVRILKVHAY